MNETANKTTAGHTSGPWEVLKHEGKMQFGYRIVSPAGDAELGNWMVAEKVPWEEDARLIAAAPDLLEALKALMAESYCADHSSQEWDRAERAILKATGEAKS